MDGKKLWRAAIEPARVFARRDFDPKSAEPLLRIGYKKDKYFAPGYPTWMFIDGDCKVLERAKERYGVKSSDRGDEWAKKAFDPKAGVPVEDLGDPDDYILESGIVIPGFEVGFGVYPATPIMYAIRRWGADEISARDDGWMLRILVDGKIVGLVRAIPVDRTQELSTPESD